MGQIIVKVPKRKTKLQLIQSEKVLNDIIEKRQQKYIEQLKASHLLDIEERKDLLEDVIPNTSFTDEEATLLFEQDAKSFDEADKISNDLEDLVSQSDATIDKLYAEAINNVIKEDQTEEIELPDDAFKEPPKTIFAEIYSISDNDKPVKISRIDVKRNTVEISVAERFVQEAYDKGYNDAQEIAKINAQAMIMKANEHIKQIDVLMTEISKHYERQIKQFNTKLIELSTVIAGAIIDKEIEQDNNIFVKQVEKALNELKDNIILNVIINPADYALLEEAKSNLVNENKTILTASIITDNNINRGSCIIGSNAGTIDANITTQINKIKEML
ncbi:MAG: hypothetical protein LBM93_00410, partial [Oscillospiraceae bacterium]|nr:hypothetical protein [Oscillospiraceae bacterium]